MGATRFLSGIHNLLAISCVQKDLLWAQTHNPHLRSFVFVFYDALHKARRYIYTTNRCSAKGERNWQTKLKHFALVTLPRILFPLLKHSALAMLPPSLFPHSPSIAWMPMGPGLVRHPQTQDWYPMCSLTLTLVRFWVSGLWSLRFGFVTYLCD